MNQPIKLNIMEESDKYFHDRKQLLTVTMQYPQLWGSGLTPDCVEINLKYENQARSFWANIRNQIMPEALKTYQEMTSQNLPFHSYEIDLKAKPQYMSQCVSSIYFDEYVYTGGAHGNTFRSSDTWNLQMSSLYQMADFFPAGSDYQTMLINEIIDRIKGKIHAGDGQYFDNYEQLVRQNFKEQNFYLTEQGMVIYFQQYEIAPYSSGIPEFLFLYRGEGPVLSPCDKNK